MENMNTYKLHQTGPETQTILDQVSTNTADIAQLQDLYQAFIGSGVTIIQPTDTWPVANPEEKVIYRVIDRVNTPPESYSDYMWNGTTMVLMATYDNAIDSTPTAGSNNPVASGGVLNYVSTNVSAYDISAANSGTAYADLAAALGTDGANVPEAVRKGGMSVKFVQTSDNKYVQYRLMNQNWSTVVTDWQGVDDEPIAGSDNLVKSGGVEKDIVKTVGMSYLYDTYIAYNMNNGSHRQEGSDTDYHASQEIFLGGASVVKCSIPFNVMMFYASDGTYLGYNSTGTVITGSSYFIIGFSSAKPYISGSTVTIGGGLFGYLESKINDVNKEFYFERNLSGFDLTYQFNVVAGEYSGSNKYFSSGILAVNDKVYCCLVDPNNCISKYSFLCTTNNSIDGINDGQYRYDTNKVYEIEVKYANVANERFGVLSGPSYSVKNGEVKFFFNKSLNGLLNYIKNYVDNNIELVTDRLSRNERAVGFEVLHQVYSAYNTNHGGLTPGETGGNYRASQKIYLEENQTKVNCSITPNAFMFYSSNDTYLGWNQTGNVLEGSSYVVIGLGYNMEFDDSMWYVFPNDKSLINIAQDNFFKNKTFAVIGDSLSAPGVWEEKFAELTGAVYLSGYSKGGEATISHSGNCGMDRARKLLNEHPEVDAIFIQNINDIGRSIGFGEITDLPYMMTQNVVSETTYGSLSQAENALATEIAAVSNPMVGTMIRIKYGTASIRVKINNAPSASGVVTINIGNESYAVTINSTMSISDVQDAILNYSYEASGYSDTERGADAVLFTDTENRGSSAPAITVNAGTTGITFTVSDVTSVSFRGFCFMSKDINDWSDTSKWTLQQLVKNYPLYKGLISWLQTNFPNAYIFMLGLPRYSWNSDVNSYKYVDGTYDWDSYREPVGHAEFFEKQKIVADYMRIPYLDVLNNCAISIYNASTFYPASDVHPKTAGYERWGETVARLLK